LKPPPGSHHVAGALPIRQSAAHGVVEVEVILPRTEHEGNARDQASSFCHIIHKVPAGYYSQVALGGQVPAWRELLARHRELAEEWKHLVPIERSGAELRLDRES